MPTLSAILAEMEALAERIKKAKAELATFEEEGKSLVTQYRVLSAEKLKELGHEEEEEPRRQRRAGKAERTPRWKAVVSFAVKNAKKGGTTDHNTFLAASLANVDKYAKKHRLEIPEDVPQMVKDAVKAAAPAGTEGKKKK